MNCKSSDFLELCTEILSRGNRLRFRACGRSMYPYIRDGDVIEVTQTGISEIRLGEVILYCTPHKKVIAHRVIKKYRENDEVILVTKGDSVFNLDQRVYEEQLLGKIIAVKRDGQYMRLDQGLSLMLNTFWVKVSLFSPWIYAILKRLKRKTYMMFNRAMTKLQSFKIYRALIKNLPMVKITYQTATAGDAFLLSQFYCYNKHAELGDPIEVVSNMLKDLKDNGYCLLAKKKGKIVGGVSIKKLPEGDSPYCGWWLFGMLVSLRYRGMGIGEQLAKRAIKMAAEANATTINLTVYETATSAVNLYRKLSFRQIYIPSIDRQLEVERKEKGFSRIIMAKKIENSE